MAKREIFPDGACLRPDLDCACESRISTETGETEYCFSTTPLNEHGVEHVVMFLDDRHCGSEPVNSRDEMAGEGGSKDWFTAEIAAMKRLVARFESQEKDVK